MNIPTASTTKAAMRRGGIGGSPTLTEASDMAALLAKRAASAPPPNSVPVRVSTATTTDMPGRIRSSAATLAGTRMRTGTRCTTLVKLPVALSGGSRLKTEPDAGATLATVPLMSWPG